MKNALWIPREMMTTECVQRHIDAMSRPQGEEVELVQLLKAWCPLGFRCITEGKPEGLCHSFLALGATLRDLTFAPTKWGRLDLRIIRELIAVNMGEIEKK